MPVCEMVGFSLLALINLAMGVRFRFGPPQRDGFLHRQTRNMDLPRYMRNTPLVLIPLSVTGLLLTVGAFCLGAGGRWADLGVAMGFLFVAGLVATIILAPYPPDWLKPAWLREEERRGGRGAAPKTDERLSAQ